MINQYADLHVHTNASDGVLTPAEAVKLAQMVGLLAVAITDHDTIEGVRPAMAAARDLTVEVVPGIEINTDLGDKGIHILGYYLDIANEQLTASLSQLKAARKERITQIVTKLQNHGLKISLDLVWRFAGSGTVGRPHVARALMVKGYATSVADAFNRYLVVGRPGYVERYKITPAEAVTLVRQCGGIPVFAHPGSANRDELLPELIELGLMGIEVYHPDHNAAQVRHYNQLAKRYHLLITGGSDTHGPDYKHPTSVGSVRIPYSHVTAMQAFRDPAVRHSKA